MIKKLGTAISEYSVRNKLDEEIPVYSVTNEQGFCTGYFSKDVASKDRTTYKIVPYGYFAYNPSRINVGSVDWQHSEERVIVSPLYVVFGVDESVDKRYLLHYLKSDIARMLIKNYASGSVRDNLKLSTLMEFPFNFRSLEEQKEIANVLDKIDYLIGVQKQRMDYFDRLVKSRFIELFGNYINEGGKPLSELATITGGLTKNSKRNAFNLKMPYLRVANVFFNRLDLNEILEIGVREDEIGKTLLQTGDLLFVEGNGSIEQIGRVAIWDGSISPILHQNHLIKARFHKKTILPEFALFYFMSQEGRQQIISKSVSTSGLNTLSVNKISSLILPMPPIELQKQFAAFVAQTDKSKLFSEMEVAA